MTVGKPSSILKNEHYANDSAIESMDHQEHIIEALGNIPIRSRYAIASAAKYLNRAGNKKGDHWEDDIIKCINFLFRSLTGKWLNEVDLNKYFDAR